MKKVLVTGAAGFIGSRICELLGGSNTTVVAIDNFDPYYDVSLKRYRWNKLQPLDHVQCQELDITDVPALEALFEAHSFDAVVNMAAMAGVRFSIENPAKYFRVNAQGFVGLLETMRKYGVTQVVQASTSSLYAGHPMPFSETLDVRTPISPYAASKLCAEALGYNYTHLHGFDVTILRYFTVYGPAGRPDMAPFRFAEWCLRDEEIKLFGDGKQSRDFTYVDDIALGTVAALQKRLPRFEIINLGGGQQPVSLNKVIEKLESLLGKKAKITNLPFHKADVKETWADISKAKSMLDWEPTISLDEGLEQCVKWYRDNQPWASSIELP